jgi:hypothetical protein
MSLREKEGMMFVSEHGVLAAKGSFWGDASCNDAFGVVGVGAGDGACSVELLARGGIESGYTQAISWRTQCEHRGFASSHYRVSALVLVYE